MLPITNLLYLQFFRQTSMTSDSKTLEVFVILFPNSVWCKKNRYGYISEVHHVHLNAYSHTPLNNWADYRKTYLHFHDPKFLVNIL